MADSLANIIEKISKLKKNDQKVLALRENDSMPMRILLKAAFDPKIQWLLPPGRPPFKPCELVDQDHVLKRETEKLRYFIKGFGGENISDAKRESMFIQILENLDPSDAELLLAVKEKQLQDIARITARHVESAFPGLLS
jgi:hypothetical protein